MIRTPIAPFACALALASFVPAQQSPPAAAPPFEQRLQAILPQPGETDWRGLEWRTELRAALLEADRVQKPILLWAMNGHPLGQC